MTSLHPATVADSLTVHGDLYDGDVERIVDHWAKLDARLRSFDAGTVALDLFVKDRDTKSQHVTLDVKIAGHAPLVATSSSAELSADRRDRLKTSRVSISAITRPKPKAITRVE